jgi:magnesium transporter
MSIRGLYARPGNGSVEPVGPGEVLHFAEGFDGVLWLDLHDPDSTDVELLRRTFAFHQLTLDDIQNARVDVPKVDDYGDYLFLITQGFSWSGGSAQQFELDIYLGRNYIVSVHGEQVDFVDQVFAVCSVDSRRLERGADVIAHWLIDKLVDGMMGPLEDIDGQLARLTESIISEQAARPLRDLLRARQDIAGVRRPVPAQLELVNKIARQEFPALVSAELTMYFRDIYDHLAHVSNALDNLRETADAALSMHLSVVNNRMNEVMKAFAVVTVIFLPLTLLASLYGMNVQLPGQEAEATFTVILVLMLGLAGAMAWYFKRKRWF